MLVVGVAVVRTYTRVGRVGGSCQGVNGPDPIGGTVGYDETIAEAGDDSVHARGGKGTALFSARRADHMHGGEEEDDLRGGSGNGFVPSDPGSNELFDGPGDDVIAAADGAAVDRVYCVRGRK